MREGWELVRADEYPDTIYPEMTEGRYAGIIGVGGLLLARIPIELLEQRAEYFKNMTQERIDAVDRELLKEQNPAMPFNIDRQSRVTFGGSRKK